MSDKINLPNIQEKLEKIAKERFLKEYEDFTNFCAHNEIMKLLKITLPNIPGTPWVVGRSAESCVFPDKFVEKNYRQIKLLFREITNFNEVEEHLLKVFTDQEINKLIKKIEDLNIFREENDNHDE